MLDHVIGAACALFIALSAWAALVPDGMGLPFVPQMLLIAAMLVLLGGHMAKHLGSKLSLAFFATAATLEWAFEETNIRYGGFIWGDLRYAETGILGPQLGSVPIAVPVLMAAILWPTYAAVNLALDGRVVVDTRGRAWWQTLWRCGLYGMVHSWYMFLCNELCVQWGLYRWVGHSLALPPADAFFGDPTAPRGWAIYVLVAMAVFSFGFLPKLGADALARAEQPLVRADAAPLLFLGVMALQLYLNPLNRTVGNVTLWTVGFFAAFAGHRFVAVRMEQRHPVDARRHAAAELAHARVAER